MHSGLIWHEFILNKSEVKVVDRTVIDFGSECLILCIIQNCIIIKAEHVHTRDHLRLIFCKLAEGLVTVRQHSKGRRLLQLQSMAPLEVKTPSELAEAVENGTLDILVTNHLDLTGLQLK